jgi:hypothetical protein
VYFNKNLALKQKMANKWLAHVKKTMKANKGKKFGEVLKLAKKSYSKKGGADMMGMDSSSSSDEEMTPTPAAGRRRRGRKTARKTRRSRK